MVLGIAVSLVLLYVMCDLVKVLNAEKEMERIYIRTANDTNFNRGRESVSYTHLTLPTILRV